MYFIQYYQQGVKTGKLIPACGDRSVVILDGRNNLATMQYDARRFNGYRRPVYDAYQIFRGNALTRALPVTEVIELKRG